MREILYRRDADAGLLELEHYPSKRIVNALLPFLYSQDEIIKWRAVTLIGIFMAYLAEEDMEAARNVMRRFMWNLNDESGGIGWGSPEAMGEILARHEELAGEYAAILLSYADKDGNYLELPMLQRGLLWGIARFSEVAPQSCKGFQDCGSSITLNQRMRPSEGMPPEFWAWSERRKTGNIFCPF